MSKISAQMLPVMEHFYTIQGEGWHQGKAAYFIRLGGCDVGCSWCDVKESWDASKHPLVSVDVLVEAALQYDSRIVVITGGEPLMYDMSLLTSALRKKGFKTHIETSGAYSLSGEWDWVCLSPKKFQPPISEIVKNVDELKIIVLNKSDFKWAELYASQVSAKCKLLLQPEWDKASQIIPLVVEYVKLNTQWEISLQTHKYMGVP